MILEGCLIDSNNVASYISASGDYYQQALAALKDMVPEGSILSSIRRLES